MQMTDLPYDLPDARGHFGPYGGVFVAETLIRALDELREQYAHYRNDPAFVAEFDDEPKGEHAGHGKTHYKPGQVENNPQPTTPKCK